MADWNSRSGLSSRNKAGDSYLQINEEGDFDFDREILGLRSQVGRLKHVTREIHSEAQDQNRLLEQMKEAMEKGQVALKRVSKKLNKVYEQSKSNHLLWLVLFAFCVIIAVWFLSKMAHISRTITGA